MIDDTRCEISKVAVHQVGNQTNGEELQMSKSLLDISDPGLRDLLMQFFLRPFANPEYYNFTFPGDDLSLNPVYNYTVQMFEHPKSFHINTVNTAKYLYELSTHPQIKSGDLFVVHFSNLAVDDVLTDAIGIFKSENRQPFLTLDKQAADFRVRHEDGINTEKLDKGCLVFNTEKENGFKVCIVDKSNRSSEAQYWKDDFLKVLTAQNDYNHTKDFMSITKNYVTKQLAEEFEVTKADQIDLLNRSVQYFKNHDTFDKEDFEEEVLQDKGIIKSFRNFDETYRQENDIEIADSFEISTQAVKKQARVFKSVLKLDKNFHVYIHGNRDLIERGVEKDGRKYYKIYFDQEQ